MAGFLYFLPNFTTLPGDRLAQVGLAHALAPGFAAAPISAGPDGSPGLVLADPANVDSVGYHPADQAWQQAPGQSWWLGTVNGAEPTPADLARETLAESRVIELADGRQWLVPVARRFDEPKQWTGPIPYAPVLPFVYAHGPSGWEATRVLPRFAALWELACDWSAARLGSLDERQRKRFQLVDGQIDAALLCLAVNYRLGPAEVTHLGLLTEQHCVQILDVLIDHERFQALNKKKQEILRSASGSPGAAA